MHKSQFIQVYKIFTKRERVMLRKWVYSPIHNKNKELRILFSYIIDRRILSKRSLFKQKVFRAIYGNVIEYDDAKLRYLMTLGLGLMKCFVGFLMQEKEIFEQEKKTFSFFKSRKLWAQAQKSLTTLEQLVEKSNYQSIDFYYHKYITETLHFELEGRMKRSTATNLQAVINASTLHFVGNQLRWACTAITHQNLYKVNYELPYIDAILADVATGKYTAYPAIMLYYHAYLALANPINTLHFSNLKINLLEYGYLIPKEEHRSFYIICINYCIKQLNTGSSDLYLRELFELYVAALNKELLIGENGQLSRFAFMNISAVALRIHEFDWASTFIKNYAHYLDPSIRESHQHHATAKLAFAKGDLDQAQALLIQVEYDDILLTVDAKIILMKIYFTQFNYDLLDALLTNLARYLERKKMLSYHKENYRNIIRFVRRLISLPLRDKKAKDALALAIQETNPLTERSWLLAKLNK